MSDAAIPFRSWSAADKRRLVVVVAVAAAIRAVCWLGIGYLDSMNYANASLNILDHGIGASIGTHQQNRLGMTVPPVAFLAVLGRTEFAVLSYFLVLAAAQLTVTPLLLARILPPRTVLVTTMLLAFAPMLVRDSTTNAADLAMGVWAGFGVLALLAAPAERRGRWFAAAGVLMGIAVIHKETALVMMPVAAALAVFAAPRPFGVRVRETALFALGFAGPMLVEAAAFHAWTGEWLHRYVHNSEIHAPSLEVMESAGTWPRFLVYWPANLLDSPQDLGVLVFVLPAALLLHAADRFRSAGWTVALWFLFPALYTLFGTSVLSGWHPLLPFPRYFHFVVLPAAILAAQVLADRSTWTLPRRIAAVGVTALLFAAACFLKSRGVESVVAGACGLVLVLWAGRGAEIPYGRVAAVMFLLPAAMAAERFAGRTHSVWLGEHQALAYLREHGVKRVHCAARVRWGLETLARLGEIPDIELVPTAAEEMSTIPPGDVAIVGYESIDRVVAAKDADGGPAFEEVASLPELPANGHGKVRVLVRR